MYNRRCVCAEFGAIVPNHPESDLRMGQCDFLYDLAYCICLCDVTFHEFLTHRHIIKQITNQECCAVRAAGLFRFFRNAAGNAVACAVVVLFPFGQHGDFGNSCNGCQRLATKAQGKNVIQVSLIRNFAGGVADESRWDILGINTGAVIADLDQLYAAGLDAYGDLRCTGVDEFSKSSLTTDAGRSTTSPAAISSAVCLSRTWMTAMVFSLPCD